MNEKRNILDTIATIISFGFCALSAVAVVSAFRSAVEEKEKLPEHITTSRGRKLFLELLPDNVYEFSKHVPRRVESSGTVAENDASKTSLPEPA